MPPRLPQEVDISEVCYSGKQQCGSVADNAGVSSLPLPVHYPTQSIIYGGGLLWLPAMMAAVLLVMAALFSTAHPAQHRLEQVCRAGGELELAGQPAVLTYTGLPGNNKPLRCHVRLDLGPGLGVQVQRPALRAAPPPDTVTLQVRVERLRLEQSPGCSRDFIQFGRDFGLLASVKSTRLCGEQNGTEYSEAAPGPLDLWTQVTIVGLKFLAKSISYQNEPGI